MFAVCKFLNVLLNFSLFSLLNLIFIVQFNQSRLLIFGGAESRISRRRNINMLTLGFNCVRQLALVSYFNSQFISIQLVNVHAARFIIECFLRGMKETELRACAKQEKLPVIV